MERNRRKRKGYLDIAKAIGVIIVLINHIGISLAGANKYLGAFYVSEFFVISGMTFRMKQKETFQEFAKKKGKRLLLPYMAYSLFYLLWYLLRSIMSGSFSGGDLLKKIAGCVYGRNYLFVAKEEPVYLMEIMNAPMWFLPALFFGLILYYILSSRLGEKKVYGVLGSLMTGIILYFFSPVLMPLSLDVAMIMQPLLFFGEKLGKTDYVEQTRKKVWILPLVLFLFIIIVTFNGAGNCSVDDYGVSVLLFLVASCMGSFICIMFSFFIERYLHFLGKGLMIIGKSTLTILCLHLFVFAMAQTAFGIIGVDMNFNVVKWSIVILGLIIPVVFDKIMERLQRVKTRLHCTEQSVGKSD